jgi:hypothetical protein
MWMYTHPVQAVYIEDSFCHGDVEKANDFFNIPGHGLAVHSWREFAIRALGIFAVPVI